MANIVINTISGISPYTIYVCNSYVDNCQLISTGVTTTPYSFNLPSELDTSTSVVLKIIDSTGCEFFSTYFCVTPTPTPTFTPTSTITPTVTPTPSITPTNYTPNPTPTNTPTGTLTQTPTPSNYLIQYSSPVIILIESDNISEDVGQWAVNNGSTFYGFTNGSTLSDDTNDFNFQMNKYMDFSGWTKGIYPVLDANFFAGQGLGITDPLLDKFGNLKIDNTFQTLEVSASTVNYKAWYTILINTSAYNGYKTTKLGVGVDLPTSLNVFKPDEIITSKTFTYSGLNYTNATYVVYTTFPSEELYLDNSSNTIYFKGISSEL
jgi:hypothetical protein